MLHIAGETIEDSTILFHVAGEVTGFQCSQSTEDSYRLLIDEALKSIDPPVFTDVYTVRFVPVMDSSGRLSGDPLLTTAAVTATRRLQLLLLLLLLLLCHY